MTTPPATGFDPIRYNDPALIVDLGVGLWAWPLPMDYDNDGRMDLVVVCPGVPSNGTWFFKNSGEIDQQTGLPLFEQGERIDGSVDSPRLSLVNGRPVVTSPGCFYPHFLKTGFREPTAIPVAGPIHPEPGMIRANPWSFVDFCGSGRQDVVIGIDFWGEYGWDDAYDAKGSWKNGPLRGYVYLARNIGTHENPVYVRPEKLHAGGRPIATYGMPSPCFADFRKVGKLDLICGEFLDGFTWFENIGSREDPLFAEGRCLIGSNGVPLKMDLCMITPVACDFNGDGLIDLVVGDEDGRVAFIENTGIVKNGMPVFHQPRYFRQRADTVKFGALATPVVYDWDGDGREDILCGNSAGKIGFIRNLGGNPPRWAEPVLLESDGEPIQIVAGENGSIQGPAETKWGYTNIGVGDWDGDGLPDLLVNSINGKILWFKNIGSRSHPRLARGEPLRVAWKGRAKKPAWNWWNPAPHELVVQWRCTPCMIDLDNDGINDLVTVDHEGYLAFFQQIIRNNERIVLPGRRIFRIKGDSVFNGAHEAIGRGDGLLRLNGYGTGGSGRRAYCFVDWDHDGRLDLMVNSHPNVNFLRNISETPGEWVFRDEGPVHGRVIANHNTAPTVAHWAGAIPALLAGSEDGRFYYLSNPYSPC